MAPSCPSPMTSLSKSFVTTCASKKNGDKSTVTALNLGQIAGKRDRASEAYEKYAAGSDGEADSQDGLKCEQLQSFLKARKIAPCSTPS